MWFYPAAPPDYFFTCQDCNYTQRVSGADIAKVIWNFRCCRACQSTMLPVTVPVARSAADGKVQVAASAPPFLVRPQQALLDSPDA